MMKRLLLPAALAVAPAACTVDSMDRDADDAAATATMIAQHFVDGYYHQFPEEAYEVGYPDTPMDSLGDRSVAAIQAWQAREDGWLDTLRSLDPAGLEGTDAAIPYAFALDRLEAAEARRICRMELWNVSPTWTGWQSMLSSTFAQQPVGTDAQRAAALERARATAPYIDTEIANLRAGVELGFTAPASNVDAVMRQMDGLLEGGPEASPFYEPATRTEDAAFRAALRSIVVDDVNPAIQRYRTYLADTYRAQARSAVGVSANPQGDACYRASVRFHTSLPMEADSIHQSGLREMERIQAAMLEIAQRSFDTSDVAALLERLRTDPQYTFRTEEDVLAYARAAVDRGRAAVPDWFGFVPEAEVVVRPFPAYQKASGGGFYSAGSEDGTRPGTYELGTYMPERISRAGMEATAFHEAYPGHHLQMSVALFGSGVHPVLRYIYVAGMAEGWGLYSERLADEMGLYTSDVDRLGMLSNEALRAARLVVDPGMHALGWTREQAIRYMLDHTAESEAAVTSEVDRYIAVPGQATAYLTGSLEIQRLRRMAQERLGDRFDIKAFHDRVLADGAVSLPMLRTAIDRWIASVERGTS
jgi:uncharacterized protein (DUF885 family)